MQLVEYQRQKFMSDREKLLSEVLGLIEKYSITAYDIAQGTGISAEGVQKIINGKSKNPLERTLKTITSYINEKYIDNSCNRDEIHNEITTKKRSSFNELPIGEQLAKINNGNSSILDEIAKLNEKIEKQKSNLEQMSNQLRVTQLINRSYLRSIIRHLNIKPDEIKKAEEIEKTIQTEQ